MPTMDSKTGTLRAAYSSDELKEAASLMRGYALVAIAAAESGHPGGTLSIMDVAAALYLDEMRHDPKDAFWSERDRAFWSAGHKAPALYVSLGMAGYFDIEEVVTLRKLNSPFPGHPHWLKLDGVEVSSGSLGQGLSVAVGSALAARLDKKDYRAYCIMGDGEQQEGQVWEAAMEAGHFGLDNLCAIIDVNRLQIDGCVADVMCVEPLADKYRSFGFEVISIDGHDMAQILGAFKQARRNKGKPTAIIANTVKGKGVRYMEDVYSWHGKAPNMEQLSEALEHVGVAEKLDVAHLLKKAEDYQGKVNEYLAAKEPKYSRGYWWNSGSNMKVTMEQARQGLGRMLVKHGDDDRIVGLGVDISNSIGIDHFYVEHPVRKERWLSLGVSEQSATCVAAGLAKEGKLPIFGTYGVFASGRNLDQIRTTVCYGNHNVMIVGAHGGLLVGPDGATHQALEELFSMCGLPNMHVEVACDAVENERAAEHLLLKVNGPKYLRFAKEATAVVTSESTPWVFGKANVIRFRGEKPAFKDAFEHVLASDYKDEGEQVALIACGPVVAESMRAAWILKAEHDIEARVLNLHTMKPMDRTAVVRAAIECGLVLTVEEHQVGGMGNQVAAAIQTSPEVYGTPVRMEMIGVPDRFGESGWPWDLMRDFGLTAEYIADRAWKLHGATEK
ncbi:MAG: transketolase [Dehalococcoidia bacterium]|nr:transketolase [Dehalococcoidia bacterium]